MSRARPYAECHGTQDNGDHDENAHHRNNNARAHTSHEIVKPHHRAFFPPHIIILFRSFFNAFIYRLIIILDHNST